MTEQKRIRRGARIRVTATLLLATGLAVLVWGLRLEMESSPLQWRLFTRLASELEVSVEPDSNLNARFPRNGPYDRRLGYARIPEFLDELEARGYRIDRQARLSPTLESFIDLGGFPIYREKAQTGLRILDRSRKEIYRARHPERIFSEFRSVPPVVVGTLLFIENRELLDLSFPTRNPAVEWDRFAAAGVNALVASLIPTGKRFGGSTLATQIEKFRHSPEGRTDSATEKLRQVLSASVRAYKDGPDTTRARERIIVDYLNSTPLSGRSGFGEVIGLGEGLHVWYGTNLDELIQGLTEPALTGAASARSAQFYKQVLSLLLGQRRPSYYLVSGRGPLADLTDAYLRLLAENGVISARLRDAALAQPLRFRMEIPEPADASYVEHKALNAVRAHLLSLLRVRSLYDLDRLDVRVESTLDMTAQHNVSEALRQFKDRKAAKKVGLFGKHLLRRDPGGVAYSVTLYERGRYANFVRVQADNLDRPLDLNEGGKFDLGSTAKLRTLATYLEIVAELHNRFASVSAAELRDLSDDVEDPLASWAARYLAGTKDRSLPEILEAAMERRYSGSPGTFFTGGGRHSFANSGKNQSRFMSVREGFRHSVNLVFIRMMRDIIKHYQATGGQPVEEILEDRTHPGRAEYLRRFADREGSIYLNRFYSRYGNLDADDALSLLASRVRPAPYRLAVAFRSVRPQAPLEDLRTFLQQRPKTPALPEQGVRDLYEKYEPEKFDLHDRGYLAGIHPLELWLVNYLQRRPRATLSQVLAASSEERQEVYQWLFKAKRKRSADTRIRIVAEADAFKKLHASWRRQGYPFASLVPSLATAIGSSADRPAALAELIGIILNDGLRLPTVRVQRLHIAEGTPFEIHLSRARRSGEPVLPKAITLVLRGALEDVVANGTAKRLAGVYNNADGSLLEVGGKTGTGDELIERYGPGTARGEKKEVSRSAAFAFFLGDRYFGVITAHVPGPNVKHHRFTSALPTQILKVLEPVLEPVLQGEPSGPIPGMGPLLAENAIGEDAGQAEPADEVAQSREKHDLSRKRSRRSSASSRSLERRAPRIIDELF
ncbi:MAG: transglycosylase domain-containing protein [Chromatiaceae bacterium]|nr:transglycosylase domain-containing protein [Chromatiaceae bacterium]